MKSTAVTIILSVALSVMATLFVEHFRAPASTDLIRARQIELVDGTGQTRGALKLESGRPELVLLDEHGETAASLWLGSKGTAGLNLMTNDHPEGQPSAVQIGTVVLGDTSPPEANMLGWGMLVRNKGRSALFGVPNQGPLWTTSK